MNYFKNLSEEKDRLNLKSEKVELALIDDIQKKYNLLKKLEAKTENELSKLKKTAIIADTEIQDFNKLVVNVEKAAKELGVSTKDINLQKLFSDVKQMQNLFNDIINA